MPKPINPGRRSSARKPMPKPTGGQPGKRIPPEMFTKDRVNELMQKRVERSHRAFFTRYGVEDLNGLDDLFGKAKLVDDLNKKIEELTKGNADLQSRYDELTNQNRELAKKYAFTSRNIKPELYSDIETYFKGKGLDINETTLNEELKTHLDWYSKPSNVVPLGNEAAAASGPDEREAASQLFGVSL